MANKKTIKQKIFEWLDTHEYLADTDLQDKIYGDRPINLSTSLGYERAWQRLQYDRKFFKHRKIIDKKHFNRSYIVKTKDSGDAWYKVGKEFYEEIQINK